jgi:hypothetical protein
MQKQFLAAAAAALTMLLPVVAAAADAQDQPSYAAPSYAQQGPQDEQIRGRIASFDGAYTLTINDERGFVDNVQLHNGTIINPTGITLQPGMVVSILGYNAGSYFAANEVDTPYTLAAAGVPYYYGHPWFYWGPAVSLNFFFGNYGWWHGGYFRGGYRYFGGGRVYYNAPVRGVYRYGTFQGRSYVAPPSRGGYVPHSAPARPPHRP